MMMRMLDSAGLAMMTDQERTADEDNPRGYYEYERVKELEGHLNETQVELHRVNSMASQWHDQWLHATRWRRKTRGWLARLLKILKVRSRSGQDPRSA